MIAAETREPSSTSTQGGTGYRDNAVHLTQHRGKYKINVEVFHKEAVTTSDIMTAVAQYYLELLRCTYYQPCASI